MVPEMKAAEPGFVNYRRDAVRHQAFIPVQISLLDKAGEVFARGRAVVSDLSVNGVGLSRVRFHEGGMPLIPHNLRIEPSASDLRGIVIQARPVQIRFQADGASIGASFLSSPKDLNRLFSEPIPREEKWLDL